MAVDGILLSLPCTISGADLSDAQFKAVMLDGTAPYSVVVSDGTAVLGVMYTNPSQVGVSARVVVSGLVKVSAAEALNIGDAVYADASGQATATAGAVPALGTAMTATTAADELVEVLMARI